MTSGWHLMNILCSVYRLINKQADALLDKHSEVETIVCEFISQNVVNFIRLTMPDKIIKLSTIQK